MNGDMVLRRPALEFDLAEARAFFRERSVLVTGGGGSIGSDLCRELVELGCPRIAVLDHFDHALLAACERVREQFPKAQVVEILCDIRDADRLGVWFDRFRPDVVINAAALKHVHLGERHPIECIRTNLFGVRNVLNAAASAKAECFVQISTDKAAAPVCVMGASKRLAELYLWGFARERADAPAMKAVRFGNILGSQGSVVPRFQRRIEAGRDLEVTHPEMNRYFMSSREAIQLVSQVCALAVGARGQASGYFLDMGAPVRIVDLARDMLSQAGADLGIVITGLREGEKLGETMFDACESVLSCVLPHCFEVAPNARVAPLSTARLGEFEEAIQGHAIQGRDGVHVANRLFSLLNERLRREEAAAG